MFTPPLDASGGIGRLVSYLLEEIQGNPHFEVSLYDTRGTVKSPLFSSWYLLRSLLRLARESHAKRIDVVHINLSTGGSTVRKSLVVLFSQKLRLPVIIHLHASSYDLFFDRQGVFTQKLIKRVLNRATLFLVLGERWRTFVIETLQLNPNIVRIQRWGVPSVVSFRAIHRDPRSPFRIAFLGRLGVRKGAPELLDALKGLQNEGIDFQCVMAGDGNLDEFRERSAELDISDRVEFPGWLDRKSATELLLNSHCLVLPSRAEGLPVSVLEAFANSVPVISSPVGALEEILITEVNSIVVDAGDVTALTEALKRLEDNEELRTSIGSSGYNLWIEHFALKDRAHEFTELWSQTCKK
jgi:glycosyltransferase involved in cell wall biosynthesis